MPLGEFARVVMIFGVLCQVLATVREFARVLNCSIREYSSRGVNFQIFDTRINFANFRQNIVKILDKYSSRSEEEVHQLSTFGNEPVFNTILGDNGPSR